MKYELRTLLNKEVIDVVDIYQGMDTVGFEMAKAYFVSRKQLDEKEFDKLFVVKNKPLDAVGRYDWWKEENPKLDDF